MCHSLKSLELKNIVADKLITHERVRREKYNQGQ